MTDKSRYFLLGALGVLLAGLGGGIIAYYASNRFPAVPAGLPPELRYVPANAALVAYADVQGIVNSDLHRELDRMAQGSRRDRQQQIDEIAGIDFKKQVHRIVAYLESMDSVTEGPPRALMLAQGTLEQARIEQSIRDHGGTIEDHNGKHMAIHRRPANQREGQGDNRAPEHEMAIGFVRPDLIAFGQADLVRRALDFSGSAASNGADVTGNAELMTLIRDAAGETAWVVGHFDAVTRRMGLPSSLREQVPPLRTVAAKAHINGGLKATISAQTADQAAGDQLRDVIRGFVSLIRLQAGAKPELQNTLKSLELGGTGSTVQLSFAITPDALRAIVPQRRQPPGLPSPGPPPPPARK